MPPVLSRKRLQSDSPEPKPPPKRTRSRNLPTRGSRESVFQTLDAPPKVRRTLSQTKALLEQEDSSELSTPDSSEDEFEDVPLNGSNKGKAENNPQEDEQTDQSEDEDWEDALGIHHSAKLDHGPAPIISGDIALTLSAAPKTAFESKPDGKRGPSKVQRQIRNLTHCMHVQYLMYSNLIRNSWIQDIEVQKILVHNLSSGCWHELKRYWQDVGITDGQTRVVVAIPKIREDVKDTKRNRVKWKDSGQNGVKLYDSTHNTGNTALQDQRNKTDDYKNEEPRTRKKNVRDWGATSEPLGPNTPDLAAGDPLIRLLKYLSAFWKSKFRITAPSLRKRGYLSPSTLETEINAWREDPWHPNIFGERVENLDAFRDKARKFEGSRDIAQQLFTALLRGLGIEARMIVSLQPIGFGWSQVEEGKPKPLEKFMTKVNSTQKDPQASAQSRMNPRPATSSQKITIGSDMSESSDLSSVISISSDSEEEQLVKKAPKARNYSEELPYPTYWTEAISPLTHTPISVSPLPRILIASQSSPDKVVEFYARGAAADKAKQVLAYLIAFSSDSTAKDVTTRYLPKRQWPGRTKGFRMPVEKIPIYNKRGKVKRWEEWDWFKSLMRLYARPHDKRKPWDEIEEESDLVPAQPERKKDMDEAGGKETLQGYKNSAEYVLERHLRREEALRPGAQVVRHFITGKGDNEKSEAVYRRKDIVNCKTVESWHKEGREIKKGEQPLKFVPMRAVTVTRKREIEERERIEGGKVQQGLYSKAQTDWIIPEPIADGKIPRNAFGNIDVYVPTMIPKGAVHIPLKGTARVCKKLNIDFAEACTGFEFGKQRAVPILTGVVVAEDKEDLVIDAWEVEEAEKARREADKRERIALGLWKKFFSGLRIIERMKAEYGEDVELPEKNMDTAAQAVSKLKSSEWEVFKAHTDFEGGFFRDSAEPSGGGFIHEEQHQGDQQAADNFLPASQNESIHGELTIDHGDKEEKKRTSFAENAFRTPISLASALQQPDDEVEGDMSDERDTASVENQILEDQPPRKTSSRSSAVRRSRTGASATETSTKDNKSLSSAVDGDNTMLSNVSSPPASPAPRPSIRGATKRKAARRSDAQIRSHFFSNENGDETDLTDMTDRNSPTKTVKSSRKGKARSGTNAKTRRKRE